MTPERIFAQRWALTVLDQVMARLQQEYSARGQGPLFDALKGSIAGSTKVSPYADLARKLSMTEGAVKMAAHRLRRHYRKTLRDEIAQTVAKPEFVDDEIRFLMDSL
jgi:RNA polymerase sigma-70 factor (ECF subfamily)